MNTTQEQPSDTVTSPAIDSDTIWVNSSKTNCNAALPAHFNLQTQEGTFKPEGNWDCFYSEIEGFEFEPGFIYQLETTKKMAEGKPALAFVKVISKVRDNNYYRIHDIWALTHINEAVIDISTNRPNIEINLTTQQVMGRAFCNQYSGNLTAYSTNKIEFGPIVSTKMMCPNNAQENVYFDALAAIRSYKIKSMQLLFFDENDNELLRFQKVD